MLFDKLRDILTTGLPLFAKELQNLLDVERIVIRLVIQILIKLPCRDCDVFCRVHLGIPPFDQLLFTKVICGFLGDLTVFLKDVEKDNIVQRKVRLTHKQSRVAFVQNLALQDHPDFISVDDVIGHRHEPFFLRQEHPANPGTDRINHFQFRHCFSQLLVRVKTRSAVVVKNVFHRAGKERSGIGELQMIRIL